MGHKKAGQDKEASQKKFNPCMRREGQGRGNTGGDKGIRRRCGGGGGGG